MTLSKTSRFPQAQTSSSPEQDAESNEFMSTPMRNPLLTKAMLPDNDIEESKSQQGDKHTFGMKVPPIKTASQPFFETNPNSVLKKSKKVKTDKRTSSLKKRSVHRKKVLKAI